MLYYEENHCFFVICFSNILLHCNETQDKDNLQIQKDLIKKQINKYMIMKISGIILVSSEGSVFLSVIILTVINRVDSDILTISVKLYKSDSIIWKNINFNPIALSCYLIGFTLFAIGIPLLAVGAAKEAKRRKMFKLTSLENSIPEIGYNLMDKSMLIVAHKRL